MERRAFIQSAFSASLLAAASGGANAADNAPEYYQLRRYQLSTAQARGSADYFGNALLPALNRLKIGPIGAFNVTVGLASPIPTS